MVFYGVHEETDKVERKNNQVVDNDGDCGQILLTDKPQFRED